jgi:hypothetical protein
MLLNDNRLDFVDSALYMEEVIKQLTNYTGAKSTAYRKDDIPDMLSLLVRVLPTIALQRNVSVAEIEKAVELQREEEKRQAMYRATHDGIIPGRVYRASDFGPKSKVKPTPEPETPQKPKDPRLAILAGTGWRM